MSDSRTIDWQQARLEGSWLDQAAHEGLARLISLKPQSGGAIVLTTREVEVLGKTSSDVGEF